MVQSHSIVFKSNAVPPNKTIICIHGANSGPKVWFRIVPALVHRGYEVHCMALPGFGESRIIGGGSVDRSVLPPMKQEALKLFYANYLKTYVENNVTTGVPSFVAHSFGGFLCSAFVAKYPQLCDTMVLVNAGGIFSIFGRETMKWGAYFKSGFPNYYMRPKVARVLIPFGYLVNAVLFTYYSIVHNKSPFDHYDVAQMTCSESIGDIMVSRFIYFDGFYSYMHGSTIADLLTAPSVAPIRISMIWGEDDTIITTQCAYVLAECSIVANETCENVFILPNVWHNPITETETFTCALFNALTHPKILKTIHAEQMLAIQQICEYSNAEWNFDKTERTLNNMYANILHIIY